MVQRMTPQKYFNQTSQRQEVMPAYAPIQSSLGDAPMNYYPNQINPNFMALIALAMVIVFCAMIVMIRRKD